MKLKIAIALFLATAAVGGWFYFGSASAAPVRVVRPEVQDLVSTVLASGRVTSQLTKVSPRSAGPLQSILVEVNQAVKKGAVLAHLDAEEEKAKVERLIKEISRMQSVQQEIAKKLAHRSAVLHSELRQAQAEVEVSNWNLALAKKPARESDLAEAKAALNEAEAGLVQANRDLVRAEELFEEDIISQAHLEKKQSAVAVARAHRDQLAGRLAGLEAGPAPEEVGAAKARLASANAAAEVRERNQLEVPILEQQLSSNQLLVERLQRELVEAQYQLKKASVYAPSDGVISRLLQQPGEHTDPGRVILEMVQPDSLWVEANVDEQDAGSVSVGQEVTLRLPSQPGREFKGKIVRVSPSLEIRHPGNTRYLPIRVEFVEQTESLKPGLEVDVEAKIVIAEQALTVPRSAVMSRDGGSYVLAVQDSLATKVEVQTGQSTPDRVEILGGLDGQTQVIEDGDAQVRVRDRVRVER